LSLETEGKKSRDSVFLQRAVLRQKGGDFGKVFFSESQIGQIKGRGGKTPNLPFLPKNGKSQKGGGQEGGHVFRDLERPQKLFAPPENFCTPTKNRETQKIWVGNSGTPEKVGGLPVFSAPQKIRGLGKPVSQPETPRPLPPPKTCFLINPFAIFRHEITYGDLHFSHYFPFFCTTDAREEKSRFFRVFSCFFDFFRKKHKLPPTKN